MLVQDPEVHQGSDARVFVEASLAARFVAYRDCLLPVVRLVDRILDVFSLVLSRKERDTRCETQRKRSILRDQ
jgi:hypothetical protein